MMGACVRTGSIFLGGAILLLYFAEHELAISSGLHAGYSNAIDLYNSIAGVWSTAQLSIARSYLGATSVGNVAIFVGGIKVGGVLLLIEGELLE